MSEVSAPIATFSREELKSRDKLEELRECFHDFGGVIVKELIDKATIKQFKASFIKLMSNVYEDILNDRLPTHDQDQLYLNLRTRAPEHASSLMGLGRDFPEYFLPSWRELLCLKLAILEPYTLSDGPYLHVGRFRIFVLTGCTWRVFRLASKTLSRPY